MWAITTRQPFATFVRGECRAGDLKHILSIQGGSRRFQPLGRLILAGYPPGVYEPFRGSMRLFELLPTTTLSANMNTSYEVIEDGNVK